MKIRHLLIATSVGMILGGCATTDNPREGGFIGGVQGLSSGSYERRVRERKDNLARLKAIQEDLDQESATLTAEKQKRQKILDEERSKLAAINKDIASLEKKLAKMEKEKGEGDARIADLQKRLNGLKAKLSGQNKTIDDLEGSGTGGADALEGSGTGSMTDARRQQLEAQRAALQKEYEELLNLTLMLAQ